MPVFQAYITVMKYIISLVLLTGLIPAVFAQSGTTFPRPAILQSIQASAPDEGNIQIVQDPQIAELLSRHIELNRRNDGLTGYRILIFKESMQNSREKAFAERSKFISHFNDIPIYYFYEQPWSLLYAGDFRTKSEATRVWQEVKKYFGIAIVVETKINFPKLDKTEDKQ